MADPTEARTLHAMEAFPGAHPEIGPWLWAMEEVRRGLLQDVAGLDQAALDWRGPNGDENAIGALLYHIAVVEMSWLYEDVLLEEVPEDIARLFPHDHRQEDGTLSQVVGEPLEAQLQRLDLCRRRFLERMRGMSLEDWHSRRAPPGTDYLVTPAWAVFHLVEHEAGHVFQIRSMIRRSS